MRTSRSPLRSASTDPLESLFRLGLVLHNLNKDTERRTGLSIVQWSILRHLIKSPGISAQDLSESLGLHPSTLSQSLKRLIRRDWILVLEDPRDSRKKVISLTRNGKRIMDQTKIQMEEMKAHLSVVERELSVLENFLSTLRQREIRGQDLEV